MGRAPCCDKEGLKKGPWTPEEDKILVDYIQSNGHGSWRSLPKLAGLLRCGKSCRLRWTNYLRPDIKRGPFTPEEQKSIIQLHGIVGNKWSTIAAQLPGRTDNEVKNYWNTHLKKRLVKMGIDPYTYSPATTPSSPATLSPITATATSATRHMAQWESARLEAEARLAKQSLLFSTTTSVAPTTVLGSQEQHVSNNMETDFFLRIWNSDVGQSFRQLDGLNSPQVGCKSEAEVACCDWSGSDDLAGDESYQLYLDLVGGDDVELNRSLFYGEFESFSLLASDDERCLEGGLKWDVESDRV